MKEDRDSNRRPRNPSGSPDPLPNMTSAGKKKVESFQLNLDLDQGGGPELRSGRLWKSFPKEEPPCLCGGAALEILSSYSEEYARKKGHDRRGAQGGKSRRSRRKKKRKEKGQEKRPPVQNDLSGRDCAGFRRARPVHTGRRQRHFCHTTGWMRAPSASSFPRMPPVEEVAGILADKGVDNWSRFSLPSTPS